MPVKPIPDGYHGLTPYLIAAGVVLKRPLENQFYGDRLGSIIDPFGQLRHISTHIEDLSPEEISRRGAAMAHGQSA